MLKPIIIDPCPQCGGRQRWDVDTSAWACWHCGRRVYVGVISDQKESVPLASLVVEGLEYLRDRDSAPEPPRRPRMAVARSQGIGVSNVQDLCR